MKPETTSKVVQAVAAFFIFLFSYTAFSKLLGLQQFESALQQAPGLSRIAPLAARAVPTVELLIVSLLLVLPLRKMGLWCSLIVLVVFTAYIGGMLVVTPQLPCSCGGVLKQLTWKEHFAFNLGCVFLAASSLYLTTARPGKRPRAV